MNNQIENQILYFLNQNGLSSSKEIANSITIKSSYATIKRNIVRLTATNLVATQGKGKSTKYQISTNYQLFYKINVEQYFSKEIDEREINKSYNFSLINTTLKHVSLFTDGEIQYLLSLHDIYKSNIAKLTEFEYKHELERLAIDLSWKSSQIEGNTYSLLETIQLLKNKETAAGKTKDEAIMLLNHKDAIDFIIANPDNIVPLKTFSIEDIHSILIKDLGVDRNIRKGKVGISGTNYTPLDNDFQIKEAITQMCDLVNARKNIFEKTFLVLILVSYIQPFVDGNKRTARIVSNAILMSNQYCPLSFRSVNPIEYKKALLIFYEQNNLSAFKDIFIDQFKFAVNTYF